MRKISTHFNSHPYLKAFLFALVWTILTFVLAVTAEIISLEIYKSKADKNDIYKEIANQNYKLTDRVKAVISDATDNNSKFIDTINVLIKSVPGQNIKFTDTLNALINHGPMQIKIANTFSIKEKLINVEKITLFSLILLSALLVEYIIFLWKKNEEAKKPDFKYYILALPIIIFICVNTVFPPEHHFHEEDHTECCCLTICKWSLFAVAIFTLFVRYTIFWDEFKHEKKT